MINMVSASADILSLTFAENFRSIGLIEEAPDEFCERGGQGRGGDRGRLYRKIRPSVQGLKGLISNYTFCRRNK